MSHRAEAIGGPIFTKPFRVLMVVGAVGGVVILWRFIAGLGATTGMNDGYPWGLWITFDVVIGTALACGGYAVALLVYLLNRGQYHPLVRPAVLTSALGYTMAGFGVFIDIGRYWLIYKVPIFFWQWNLNSVLLEVALCVMSYIVVLWIELAPAFLEKWQTSSQPLLRRIAATTKPVLDRALLFILALGILLPTMHQSSLGSVFLITTTRMHGLWHTAFLPLLFLLSCVAMGYAVVVLEASLSSLLFRRPSESKMLASLAKAIVPLLLLYLGIRWVDLLVRGRGNLIVAFDGMSLLFWVECLVFLVPAVMLLSPKIRSHPGHLFRLAMLMILAGALYRFDTYLVAYDPGYGWSYFPAVPEILATLGVIAFEIMAYVVIVKQYPILSGRPATAPAH